MTGAQRLWERVTPAAAVAAAVAILAVGLGLAVYNEHIGRTERVRQAAVQAQILAGSLAAPLAFDDLPTAREYLNALQANPEVEAAAAYDSHGRLAAGFTRDEPLPQVNVIGPPRATEDDILVTARAAQGDVTSGSVYLRTRMETLARRAVRYLGIALLIVMASLMVGVLGSAQARMREANTKLQREIFEREKAEEALRQSQKMEAMGQLTGGVAHDFNNLLMAASSGLDLMDRTNDPARRERLKAGIRQALDRGASLTQQLLAFARRAPLKPEVIDLGARLAGMQDLLDRALREDIRVSVQSAPDLWPIEVDPSQLEVAVLNVALNARDAMPSGGAITVQADNVIQAGDEWVRLSITDSGVGMPPELITRVFEPFFTTKGVGKGTGLGLSQVYGFARAAGGEVRLESRVGEGTTLSMLIPRSHKTPPTQAAETRVAIASGRRCRILLVEDDDTVANLVQEMLAELKYDVARAATALDALETLGHQPAFDLVFSDMVMPGEMDGLDLVREINRRHPGLPVVLTTGYSRTAAAAAAEGIRLLVKPYRIQALSSELQAAIGARSGVPPMGGFTENPGRMRTEGPSDRGDRRP